MRYTKRQIKHLSEAADPKHLLPAPSDAGKVAREIADAVADAYTEDDWRYVLNTLSPDRAAVEISTRPFADRHQLLGLIDPNRRVEVERHLAAFAV